MTGVRASFKEHVLLSRNCSKSKSSLESVVVSAFPKEITTQQDLGYMRM
jgi:transcription initiation factor IIE alpha subunit